MSQPFNDLLRAARHAMFSPTGSGRRMSRQELAEAVNACVFATTGRVANLNANYIGKLERGTHRWPTAITRAAFRAVLGAKRDSELGFWIIYGERQPEQVAAQVAALPGNVVTLSERRHPMVYAVVNRDALDAS